MVEKQLHSFDHRNDIHCSATDKHFHVLEHNCSICDFTVTSSDKAPESFIQFLIAATPFYFQALTESINISNAFKHLPSRAPPIV
jgi:hypothetical protein